MLGELGPLQCTLAQACRNSTSGPAVVDLGHACPGLLPPTLNGLLLGYPAVYVLEGGTEGAAAAARCLSTEDLVLIRMHAAVPKPIIKALTLHTLSAPLKQRQENALSEATVFAFSVPAALLCGHEEGVLDSGAMIGAWANAVKLKLETAGWTTVYCASRNCGISAISF